MRSYSQLGTLGWRRQAKRIAVCMVATLGALVGWPALAVDGLLEINQTCAVNTGCFAGDSPGFPVEITAPGSYRLTSNLSAANAISIAADFVTVDLNGFRLEGDGTATGVKAEVNPLLATEFGFSALKNGFVHHYVTGVALGYGARVENVSVAECSSEAVALGTGTPYPGMVRESVILGNAGTGLVLGSNAGYADNILGDNGTNVSGGYNMGGNVCDGKNCAMPPTRRYYLTQVFFAGDQALSACAPGFHMASLWEIFDTSNLVYDSNLGLTLADSGSGPPNFQGWVRTGSGSSATNFPGDGNCNSWTSTSSAEFGTIASPPSTWVPTPDPSRILPWVSFSLDCSLAAPVWFVQD